MKNLKGLFLSATALFLGLGVLDSADAFVYIGKFQKPKANIYDHNLDFVQFPRQKSPFKKHLADHSLEADQAQRTALANKILHDNQMRSTHHQPLNSFNSHIELIRTLEAKVDSLTEEIRQSREEAALRAPQALPIASEAFREQIDALSAQVRQLQESNLILTRSLAELQERNLEESIRSQPVSLPSSAIRSSTEGGFTETPRPSDDATSDPTATLTTTSFSTMPELEADAINSDIFGASEFERTVLGVRPTDLSSMDEKEKGLWRAFTLLTYGSFIDRSDEKGWSTWDGTFTTSRLEEMFEGNDFMKKAFQAKQTSLSLTDDRSFFTTEPKLMEYFRNNAPKDLDVLPFTTSSRGLNTAYYLRGLYSALTGRDLVRLTDDFPRAEFILDLEKGAKGGYFRYNAQSLGGSIYEIPLYEAEKLYTGTPWHRLFIGQTQKVIEDALRETKIKTMADYMEREEKIDAKIKELGQKFKDSEEPDPETQGFIDIENRALIAIDAEKSIDANLIEKRMTGIIRAQSLRDIDEALQIS